MIPEAGSDVKLYPCPICGRTFHSASLEKHRVICEKTNAKKRKIFDSSKQRAGGAEPGSFKPQKNGKKGKHGSKPSKKSNWKEVHAEFIKTIRAAKKGTKDEGDDDAVQPTKPSIPIGYIQCPTCERNFSQKAADRHIAWCKEQKNKIKLDSKSSEATERLKARTKYQAPMPGKKALNGNSDSRTCESAKDLGRSVAPVKSSKVRPSLPSTSLSGGRRPEGNSNINSNGSRKLAARKEQLDKKLVLPLKDIRHSINVTSHKIPSPRNTENAIIRSTVVDHSSALDSYNHLSSKPFFRCSKPFGSMAPRTVPGVRTNSISNKDYSRSNGLISYRYDSLNSSNLNQNRIIHRKSPDEDDIDEIDIGRHNSHHSRRRSSSPNNRHRTGAAFTSYRQNNNNKHYHGSDSDTRGSTSGSDSSLPPLSIPTSGELYRLPRFCHDCGTKYPIATAKFCCECGLRRFSIDSNTA